MAPALPTELVEAVKAVFGGAGIIILFLAWGLWRHWAQRETDRQGRLDRGFSALDQSRDTQIKSLTEGLEAERRRHQQELERMERRLAAKAKALEETEISRRRRIEELEEDRDRGWDLARECDGDLHTQRHLANNRIAEAFAAGRLGQSPPAPVPPIPPLHERAGKRPE